MTTIHYHVVEHDGGWAYKLEDVYSETFRTHEEAVSAAHRAAQEQEVPGASAVIQYQDAEGHWRTEIARGDDRPEADVDG